MTSLVAFPADGILSRTMSLIVGRDLATPETSLGVIRFVVCGTTVLTALALGWLPPTPALPLDGADREIRLLGTAAATQHGLLQLYGL